MARPRKVRRVEFLPGVTYFKPRGVPMRFLEEVRLSVDELESIRLKDLDGLEGEEAALKMGVSRPTFQRILEEARRKVAESLVRGKALRIEGGDFEVPQVALRCGHCGHAWEETPVLGEQAACPNCEEETELVAPPAGAVPHGRHRHGQSH